MLQLQWPWTRNETGQFWILKYSLLTRVLTASVSEEENNIYSSSKDWWYGISLLWKTKVVLLITKTVSICYLLFPLRDWDVSTHLRHNPAWPREGISHYLSTFRRTSKSCSWKNLGLNDGKLHEIIFYN